ncbi:MAG: class I SAM-dependent methyltransferase [Anaerolineales bacterium]
MTGTPFDERYFHTGPYARVSFRRFSQYWWSNRFYAALARRFGPPRGRLLEVGCGLGHLLARLQDRFEAVGVDVNSAALREAAAVAPRARLEEGSAEDLGHFADGYFSVVIAKHVVEHLRRPETAVAEFGRVLSPGGILILSTPNLDSPMHARKKEAWVGYRDPTHISLRRPAEWLNSIRRSGMDPAHTYSDGFWDPPYVRFLPIPSQKILFGLPGGIQAILGVPFLPPAWGESLIVIARRTGGR